MELSLVSDLCRVCIMKKITQLFSLSKAFLAYIIIIISMCIAQSAFAKTNVRSINDFVSTQGSTLVSLGFVNGGELFGGKLFIWGNSLDLLMRVDYAGSDNKGLIAVGGPDAHTSYSGTILETPLPDGRAEVKITLVTHNAIAFADNASSFPAKCTNNGSNAFFTLCPAVFGYNIVELANGIGKPVLVNSEMEVNLVNTAPGAPIPDLLNVIGNSPGSGGAYVKTLTLKTTSIGPLREAFGVTEGSNGIAKLNVIIDNINGIDNENATLRKVGE
jgi:hypothetical protein